MIEYTKEWSDSHGTSERTDHGKDRPALILNSKDDRDLAARILDAEQWAEANDVDVTRAVSMTTPKWRAQNDDGFSDRCDSRVEAIEALRAKVEPEQRPLTKADYLARKMGMQMPSDKQQETNLYENTCGGMGSKHEREAAPDKRVSAELWGRLLESLIDDRELSDLEACPDIVDEGATLHPATQAVLEAARRLRSGGTWHEHMNSLLDATEAWIAAGHPTVVPADPDSADFFYRIGQKVGRLRRELEEAKSRIPSPEDAATLAALHECRELGLSHARHIGRHGGEWHVWDGKVGLFADTLPEALAAYKAAQAPNVEDGWRWFSRNGVSFVGLVEGGLVYHPSGVLAGKLSDFTIGPECPPPPKGDE